MENKREKGKKEKRKFRPLVKRLSKRSFVARTSVTRVLLARYSRVTRVLLVRVKGIGVLLQMVFERNSKRLLER